MRISDWSSDVCSSDLQCPAPGAFEILERRTHAAAPQAAGLDLGGRDQCPQSGETIRRDQPMADQFTERGFDLAAHPIDRKSVGSGKSVSVPVDLGGRRSIKKKKRLHITTSMKE